MSRQAVAGIGAAVAAGRSLRRGLAQSLIVARQRKLLDRVGARAGTPVIYVKAAWAEPVLYGGLGHRFGCDVDVLVRRDRFRAFARELTNEGFRRLIFPGRRFASAISKEWLFASDGPFLAVDLHRCLADAPWFREDSDACIARAVRYDSVDGPVLSLCPEDQVVYAAVHHAQSLFRLDGRHLEDTRRLIACRDIDWEETWRTARTGYSEVPLVLLADGLRASGVVVPIDREWLGRSGRLRLRVAEQFVVARNELSRRRTLPRLVEYTTLMPSMSGRLVAFPLYAARFALQRSLDGIDQLWARDARD